jgi:hypothetical protein
MASAAVTTEQILHALQRLPAERWGEVLHVIEELDSPQSTTVPTQSPIRRGTDLRNSALIGIWAGRDDLGSSREFAEQLRRRAEQRDEQGPPNVAGH